MYTARRRGRRLLRPEPAPQLHQRLDPAPVPPALAPQTIHIAGSNQSFVWAPRLGTLLDAADAAGLALPSGCRAGQCESCAMRIVAGDVAHLGPFDGDETQCLTCQAIPLSELTLAL